MKHIYFLVSAISLATSTVASASVLDQISDVDLCCHAMSDASGLLWQQTVTVGIDGKLVGVDVQPSVVGQEFELTVRLDSLNGTLIFQENVVSTVAFTHPFVDPTWFHVDISNDHVFNIGDTLVIGMMGLDNGGPSGNFRGSGAYAGGLRFLNGLKFQKAVAFRTLVSTGSPEPSTFIPAGPDSGDSTGGGSSTIGGVDVVFDDATTEGTFSADFFQPTTQAELENLLGAEAAGLLDFQLATDPTQMWQLDFSGDFSDQVTLSFGYDDTGLSSKEEAHLRIRHFVDGIWTTPSQQVFKSSNTIVLTVDSFSPFVLSSVVIIPEPSTLILATLGLLSLGITRRRRRR